MANTYLPAGNYTFTTTTVTTAVPIILPSTTTVAPGQSGQYLTYNGNQWQPASNYIINNQLQQSLILKDDEGKTVIIFSTNSIEIIGYYPHAALTLFKTILSFISNGNSYFVSGNSSNIYFSAGLGTLLIVFPKENYKLELGQSVKVAEDWQDFVDAFERVKAMISFV
jgi:hypothetical protein